MAKWGKSTKTPYTLHSPSPEIFAAQQWKEPYIQGLSIDPALNHFAVIIERRYHSGLIMGIHSEKYKFSARSVDLAAQGVYQSIYHDATLVLEGLSRYYPECHYFVIEKQPPLSEIVMRITQHTLSFFLLRCSSLPLTPRIIEVDSKLKGKLLGAPAKITKAQRPDLSKTQLTSLNRAQLKKWSEEYGFSLLRMRGDQGTINSITRARGKKNDLTDALVQFEALLIVLGYPSTKDCVALREKRHELQHKQTTCDG